jgi:hypothetical protein
VHENVLAVLPADEAVAFGVIEPLHCSLFHICTGVPFLNFTLEGVGRKLRKLLAVEARTANDRFGLTYRPHGTLAVATIASELISPLLSALFAMRTSMF